MRSSYTDHCRTRAWACVSFASVLLLVCCTLLLVAFYRHQRGDRRRHHRPAGVVPVKITRLPQIFNENIRQVSHGESRHVDEQIDDLLRTTPGLCVEQVQFDKFNRIRLASPSKRNLHSVMTGLDVRPNGIHAR